MKGYVSGKNKHLKVISKMYVIACFYFVLSIINIVKCQEECYKEEFSGSLGIFDGECAASSFTLFKLETYEGFEDIPQRPEGANDYFVINDKDAGSCISTRGLEVAANTEIHLTTFTSNTGVSTNLRWAALNAETGSNIVSGLILIDDSKTWITNKLTISRKNTIRIQIQCDQLPGGFVAIDNLVIKTIKDEDCPLKVTTVSPTFSSPTVTPVITPTGPSVTTPHSITPTIAPPTTLSTGTPTGPSVTTPHSITPTIAPPTTLATGTPTGPSVTTPHSITPTIDPLTTFSTGTPTGTPPTNPVPPVNPTTLPPSTSEDYEKWRIISIIAISLASCALAFLLVLTIIVFSRENGVIENTSIIYDNRNPDYDNTIMSDKNQGPLPRLQVIRGTSKTGESFVEITGNS